VAGDNESEERAFVKWARRTHVPMSAAGGNPADLAAFGQAVGDSRVVALGEGVHLAREPLELRNRLFQYLVEEKDFTAIAIESGIVEGRGVYDYVRGGAGELSAVLREGISWTFDRLAQNESLVRWLKQHNANPKNRQVNFYGFDVPGSPGNPAASRGHGTALTEALRYLTSVDRPSAVAFHARVDPVVGRLGFEFYRAGDTPGYRQLVECERDRLTAAIADLIALFDRREACYATLSGPAEYEWAYRAAIGARQVDQWLRRIPLGWEPPCEPVELPTGPYPEFFAAATEVRDRAQAENLEWILRREGDLGKVLIYGHNYHLSCAPVRPSWAGQGQQEVMGTYLRRRLGDRLLTIGNLIGGGEVGCSGSALRLTQPACGSLEELAREVGEPAFLLDLRRAPRQVAKWLDREREIGLGPDALKLSVAGAFDALLWVERVTPADRTRLFD
jgi:erythromycin esterase